MSFLQARVGIKCYHIEEQSISYVTLHQKGNHASGKRSDYVIKLKMFSIYGNIMKEKRILSLPVINVTFTLVRIWDTFMVAK